MKKLSVLVFAVCAALVLASCGAKKDANGWYEDFGAAKKEASSKNKNILIFVNSDMDIQGTKSGVDFLLASPDFTKALKDKYVCLHFDFTDLSAAMAEVKDGATNKEQKAAERNRARLDKQFRIADSYMIQETPAVVLATKEGYFITDVTLDFLGTSVEGYVSSISLEDDAVKEMNTMVAATKKGSKIERVKAIDALYESQSEPHRLLISDLYRKIPSLDRKNETGLVSKYIFAVAHADAYKYIVDRDIENAVKIYESSAADKRVSAEDSQSLYYIAASILANSRTDDINKVVSLLEKSIAADSESDYVANIQNILDVVKKLKAEQDASDAEQSARKNESADSESSASENEAAAE